MKEILKQMNWRYAVKQFDPNKKLSTEQISFLKEGLRLSPSSFGLQPWKFLFIESADTRAKIRPLAWNQAQVEDASHLIVLCRPSQVSDEDVDRFIQSTADTRNQPLEALEGYSNMIKGFLKKFSEERTKAWMENQVYLSLGNLLTLCAVAGIDACPMEGFDAQALDKLLNLPGQGLNSVVLCPVGARLDSDKYATLKKVRYQTEQIIADL